MKIVVLAFIGHAQQRKTFLYFVEVVVFVLMTLPSLGGLRNQDENPSP
jgi:hypothetical protein